jgi:signal transduction histidine kinase
MQILFPQPFQRPSKVTISTALLAGVEIATDRVIKLLVIDDAELDRKIFTSALQRGGELNYEIHEAQDISEGLQQCADIRPDCVLLDYNLQGEAGTDWISECKTQAHSPFLPVIVLTGAGDESLVATAFHAGAADYIAKSKASGAALERAVKNALQQAELRATVEEEREERERLHQQLKAKNEELQMLYRTVSHELKTPLTAAREFVSLMIDGVGGPVTETQMEFLQSTQGCCDRLSFLLNNWLDTVRSETGKLQLLKQREDLAQLLEESIKTYDVLAIKSNVELVANLSDVGCLNIDRERILQVLANLLSNAFKFTPDGGQVTVSCSAHDDEVQIQVSDNGRGILPAHQEQIFSPFFQTERSDASEAKGMGLGLHVCRTIIELHGGSMTLVSTPDVGSVFTIHLPVHAVNQGELS